MQVKSGPYIVEDGQRDEKTDILKSPGDSFCCNVERFQSVQPFSIKKDISLRRLIDPGDHIEDRGLTGSVGSDYPYQLMVSDGHIQVRYPCNTSETHGSAI